MYKNSEKLLYRFKYFLSPSETVTLNFLRDGNGYARSLPDKLSIIAITVTINRSQYDLEMSHVYFFRKEKSRPNAEENRDRNQTLLKEMKKLKQLYKCKCILEN